MGRERRIVAVPEKITWQGRAEQLKIELWAIYLAYRDPRIPWYARVFAALVVGYAFSPVDLIPDFIPVLGYLDDLVLLPLGVTLALKMIPPEVMTEYREKARILQEGKPVNWAVTAVIIGVWVFLLTLVVFLLYR